MQHAARRGFLPSSLALSGSAYAIQRSGKPAIQFRDGDVELRTSYSTDWEHGGMRLDAEDGAAWNGERWVRAKDLARQFSQLDGWELRGLAHTEISDLPCGLVVPYIHIGDLKVKLLGVNKIVRRQDLTFNSGSDQITLERSIVAACRLRANEQVKLRGGSYAFVEVASWTRCSPVTGSLSGASILAPHRNRRGRHR